MLKQNAILILILTVFNTPGQAVVNPERTGFLSATLNHEVPLSYLKMFAAGAGQKSLAAKLKHGVKSYTIVYETAFDGRKIKASGLLLIPQQLKTEAPLLSLQHGTTLLRGEAPSVSGSSYGMEFFASAGYVTIIPDYIGYGVSKDIFHPYYDKTSSAQAVIDMINSSKTFLKKEGVGFNEKLFLAGYSEGGYVTMATAEEIDRNAAHRLSVTAVAAGAGGYDLMGMLKEVTTKEYYAYPAYLAFVLMSYNTTYKWSKSLNFYFNSKYAKILQDNVDGGDSWYVNSRLPNSLVDLFNPEFYYNLKTKSGALELKKVLQKNSISGWKASFPIRLYHGSNDEIIPYANSESTLASFKNAGVKDISLINIPGGSHGGSFFPMLQAFVPWFDEFR